jgi:probable rRNA maturation factor
MPLGDIVVCAAIVRSEAEEQGKVVADHWAHMMVHGTLHLLGFDHENDGDAAVMESLEIQILSDHGIANPYSVSIGESPQET